MATHSQKGNLNQIISHSCGKQKSDILIILSLRNMSDQIKIYICVSRMLNKWFLCLRSNRNEKSKISSESLDEMP